MLTNHVCSRVFRLRYKGKFGTCFTIDIDNKQYLITAKHVVEHISLSDIVSIYHEGQWKDLDVFLLGKSEGEIDIAVFRPGIQLSPNYPLEPTIGGIYIGQDAYFLGFPYELGADVGEINRDFPMPFVKRCCVSLLINEPGGGKKFYLDGYNNIGFSGGPVIFRDPTAPPSESNPYKVAAVVKCIKTVNEEIYDPEQRRKIHLTYSTNTGIMIAYAINHAIDIIQYKPDGFLIAENNNSFE